LSIDLSFTEFLLLVFGIIGLIILIYVIIYEYRVWRTKRIAKVIRPSQYLK